MTQQSEPNRGPVRFGAIGGACLVALLGLIMLAPTEAQAYVGPGAGITAIGSLFALLAGVLFAIVGFIWYPIKRLRRRRKAKQVEEAPKT